MSTLAFGSIPFETRSAEAAGGTVRPLCSQASDNADAAEGDKWVKEWQANSVRHQALGVNQERYKFLDEASGAVKTVCRAKRSSISSFKDLMKQASAAPSSQGNGDVCGDYKAVEKVYLDANSALAPYLKLANDYYGGASGEHAHPGLRALYRSGTQADFKHVQSRTDDAKAELEKERAWAWGPPPQTGSFSASAGYFSGIYARMEAEWKEAQGYQSSVARGLGDAQKKYPACTPSQAAKDIVAGKGAGSGGGGTDGHRSDVDDSSGAGKNGKGKDGKGKDGKGGGDGDETGGGDTSLGGNHGPGGSGASTTGDTGSVLGDNAGLIAGGVLLAGAAGAAAWFLLGGKDKKSSSMSAAALASGASLPTTSSTDFGKAGDAPIARPAVMAIDAAKFPLAGGLAMAPSPQGSSDFRMQMSDAELDARYGRIKEMGLGYRQYNYYWSSLESTDQPGAATPLSCPGGTVLIPANESERAAQGFHHYHCYSLTQIAMFDALIKRDAANGMQTGLVMWSSPPMYRDPGCQGFTFGGGNMKDGCVPRDDAMDDWEDFVNFTSLRYNGGDYGKLSHLIVWNENNSPDWFDYTPATNKTDSTGASVEKRIDKYAAMFKRAHDAVLRHQKKVMMYVSTDLYWGAGIVPGNMGTKQLVDGLWARLGLDYSWSIAVHPYGNVTDPAPPNTYSFQNIEFVYNYQKQKLAEKGISDPLTAPQGYLAATEQGWGVGANGDRSNQAKNVCLAHDRVSRMPFVVYVGNNYFHSTEAQEGSGTSNQGEYFGLIPYSIPNTLVGAEGTPTGGAYFATGSVNWAKNSANYCCQNFQVGCAK